MPYIPSKKTPIESVGGLKDKEGKALDRKLIDKKVIKLSEQIANNISKNNDILSEYNLCFLSIGSLIREHERNIKGLIIPNSEIYKPLANTIIDVSHAYGYQGAFLGELNYAITRLIQEVPKRLVEQKKSSSELRYYIYALTVSALIKAANIFGSCDLGINGVFEDIKDEYKRRVNPAYEALQIVKSGDCYDTPYHTKLIEIVDQDGIHVGYQEVMIEHKDDNGKDIFGKLIITKI